MDGFRGLLEASDSPARLKQDQRTLKPSISANTEGLKALEEAVERTLAALRDGNDASGIGPS